MLILGPYTSWKLWNTQREKLLRAEHLHQFASDALTRVWNPDYQLSARTISHARQQYGDILDYLTPKPIKRNDLKTSQQFIYSHLLPARSVVKLTTEVYCLAPFMVYVMLSNHVDLVTLLRLGMRMCATFSDWNGRVIYNTPQIATVSHLNQALDLCSGMNGIKKARRCISYIANGAASPAEESLYLLLCLPQMLGGCALSNAVLNMPLSQNSPDNRHGVRFGDLCWPGSQLCVEYDSAEFHESLQSHAHDSIRRLQLMQMGYTVITITDKQLFNVLEFRECAHEISRIVGKRIRYTTEFYHKQMQLRYQLFRPFEISSPS